ncbi:MAG: extracellular solute-binding protein [Lachnospiraceae bacterium]|nr:extracellular solute-binding protein [Lachnospiraceae bacterium]
MLIKKFAGYLMAVILSLAMVSCGTSSGSNKGIETVEIVETDETASNTWSDSHALQNACYEIATVHGGILYGCYTSDIGVVVSSREISGTEALEEITIEGAESVQAIQVNEEGEIFVVGLVENKQSLWKILTDGTVERVEGFQLEDLASASYAYAKDLYFDEDGNLYLWYELALPASEFYGDVETGTWVEVDRIYVMDSQLQKSFYIDVPNARGTRLYGFCFDENNTPVILASDDNGLYAQALLSGQIEEGTKTRINADDLTEAENAVAVEGGILFLSGNDLYRYTLYEDSAEYLLNLSRFGIASADVIYMGLNGANVEFVNNYAGSSASEYTVLKLSGDGKIQLTLGVVGVMSQKLENIVTAFNRSSEDVQIILVDYCEEDDFETARDNLYLEFIMGEAPDIIVEADHLDYGIFASMGLLADLYEFMETDEEVNQDQILSNVLQILETDGHLYELTDTFSVYSMWGSSSVVQGKSGVTLTELMELLEDNGKDINAILGFAGRDDIILRLCTLCMDEFIDWNTSTCDFENETFEGILRFANEFEGLPQESGGVLELVASGNALLSFGEISSVATYQIQNQIYGNDIEFIGFPTADGTGTAILTDTSLAINANSEYPEGAWEFVRYYVLNGSEYGGCFPIVKSKLDEAMEDAMSITYSNDNENNTQWPMIKASQYGIEIYQGEQSDVDAVMELIALADSRYYYNPTIMNIINEEAAYYFAGQKSFEEVAAIIQNRVQLYLAED